MSKALFLESLPYHGPFKVGSHHYAERFLGDGWDLMWLSQPLSPLHLLHPVKRDFDERYRGWRQGPLTYGRLRYYSPFTLLPTASAPVLRSGWVARHSASATWPRVSRVVEHEGFSAPDLAWLTNPVFQPLVEKLDARCVAVRLPDDHASFRNVPHGVAERLEAALSSADVIFAVAQAVTERLSVRYPNVVRLPNGVDFEHFSAPRPEPEDISALPHPRVLYVGALEYWFDSALLAECARRYPGISFVVVGPKAGERLTAVAEAPNVHVLGARAYEDVPAYMQHCDVGIVPFERDELVDAIHPIKVYEYLAAGLPVVSIRWPELVSMDAATLVDREDFVEALGEAIFGQSSEADVAARRAYAGQNSWDSRYQIVRNEVSRVLGSGAGR